MRQLRVLAILLTLGVGGGPAVLDGCLVNCHDADREAGPAHCHEAAPASSGMHWQAAASSCGHDHSPAWADATESPTRAQAKALAVVDAVPPMVSDGARCESAAASRPTLSPPRVSAPVPLRV